MTKSPIVAVPHAPDARPAAPPATWVRIYRREVQKVINGQPGRMDVPCDGCTACCRNGYQVKLVPWESGKGLRFDTLPNGLRLVRKAQDGMTCTHLIDGRCEVYDHRPVGCRVFDCRVLFWAGCHSEGPMSVVMARWVPTLKTLDDRAVALSIRARASEAILDAGGYDKTSEMSPWIIAVIAVMDYDKFLPGAKDIVRDPTLLARMLDSIHRGG